MFQLKQSGVMLPLVRCRCGHDFYTQKAYRVHQADCSIAPQDLLLFTALQREMRGVDPRNHFGSGLLKTVIARA